MNRKLTQRLILCALIMLLVAPGVLLADEIILPTPMSVVVKPGSDVNPFNTRSRGVTPVAILGDDSIDVRAIDPVTIACTGVDFGDVVGFVSFAESVKPIRSSYEDLDDDGFEDMNLKFDTQSILNALQNALPDGFSLMNGQPVTLIFSAVIQGETDDQDVKLEGSDTILIKLNANNGRNVKNVKKPKTR